MCGIVGLIGNPPGEPERLVRVMTGAMFARGPDGDGFFFEAPAWLGMRRLSVIDLEHGWQPQTAGEGDVVAFQNGEIYNHRQLRLQLAQSAHPCRTASDTEVLAQGYAAWGIDGLLARIDGMYALAILDRRQRRLHLARDRFGEKPLFYRQGDGWVGYSSDLLTLVALPGGDAQLDPIGLEYYLALHFVPGDKTIFRGLSRVLPGEYLSIDLDRPQQLQRHRYFQQRLRNPRRVSTRRLASALTQAVESRLEADVPVGVFLSGGLDSSLVAAIAARSAPGIDTFSMGFPGVEHDESEHARRVAECIGSHHHQFMFDSRRFSELLPEVAAVLDEPIGDQATLPLYWLCREARQHVTVALAGEGADEIFAGYDYYREFSRDLGIKSRFYSLLGHARVPIPISRLIHNQTPVTPSGFPLLTDIAGRSALLEESLDSRPGGWERQLLDWLQQAREPLQRATAADLVTWLPDDLLVKFDRMAMAHSLEGRAPFLAPQLVDLALHLPGTQRMVQGTSKVALRRVAEYWLPAAVTERRKQGFVLPMREWLLGWFERHGGATAYFSQGREVPGLHREAIVNLVEADIGSGLQRERMLFALVLLHEWYASTRRRVDELAGRFSG